MNLSNNHIPIFDIYLAAYLETKGIPPHLSMYSGRVIFEFESSSQVYALLRKYGQNPSVLLLDYVRTLRQLRSQMIHLKRNPETRRGQS